MSFMERVKQSEVKDRERLLKLLHRNSFKYAPDKRFKLTCGAQSDVYFDCKRTSLTSEGLMLIGKLLYLTLQ